VRATYDIDWNDFPPDLAPAMRAFIQGKQRVRTAVRELGSVYDTLMQIGALDGLGNLPVTVISSDRWLDKDPDIAASARNGTRPSNTIGLTSRPTTAS
jgi:hypothetical protein